MIGRLVAEPLPALLEVALAILVYLIVITAHEVAHGAMARGLGDPTALTHGRLGPSPLPHLDPFGLAAFLVAGVGWSRPTPVNTQGSATPVRDAALVLAAGLAVSFALAGGVGAALRLVPEWLPGTPAGRAAAAVGDGVYRASLRLALLNLVPIPPLDAGHFLPYLVRGGAWPRLHRAERWGPPLLLLLAWLGPIGWLLHPIEEAIDALLGRRGPVAL